ncbi:ATP-binding protein [Rubrivirga sp. S365]|uniref:ATP-binding protein n=1 Tax=Rubrivirga sp. S365 TaxID=3076080 RepID=UPI0028CAC40C|nr:ATP-binding protein [Rubrivirga sp. S365]MDT7856426.1 ATP-binding protein [Rubrivirga sp. S365]
MTRLSALPISARLALWYALTLFLLLSAFAVFCYVGFHAAAHRSFDRHLDHELEAVVPLLRVGADGVDASALGGAAPVATRLGGPSATFVRVLTPGGAVASASANVASMPPLGVELPSAGGPLRLSREWAGEPVRSLVAPLRAPGGAVVGYAEVSGVEWSRHRELRDLGRTLALGVALSVLFALGAGWWLARRALRPVAVLTDAAGRLAADGARLGGRLPSSFRTRDELTALAQTFNGLLARLEASVERERRFTSNAAHELLTPLATLRSEAEVALRRDREPEAYRETLGRVVEDVAEMTGTVRGLLQLARAESLPQPPGERLDLGELVARRAERARAEAEAKGVALSVDVAAGVRVRAEAAPLAEVVDNLVGNAVKYTPPGGRVAVRLSHAGGAARLEVADTGAGFDGPTCERLFDRFFRADAPEVQAESGSGLGLAIVKAIVEGYGGTVGCASDGPGRGATFWAVLPCLGGE